MTSSTPSQDRKDRFLADIIKETHASLRNKVQNDLENDEAIWIEHVNHVQATSQGQNYAEAMKSLSEDHWKNEDSSSRLHWICGKIKHYFRQGDEQRFISRLLRKQNQKEDEDFEKQRDKVEILDVGSCFNPFKKLLSDDQVFEITAIDLNPACQDVIQADFLQENYQLESQADFFDAVIFCLLLEYLPSPKLRLKAVEKAIRILKPFGLLVIVTPDSSHQGKNMNQIKSWRLALAKLGMIRIYIEKLKHVHCMAFVKVDPNDYSLFYQKELEQIHKKYDNFEHHQLNSAFYIPQD